MTHVLVTGATGRVGRFVVDDLLAHGYKVTAAGRSELPAGMFPDSVPHRPFDLEPLADFDSLVDGFDGIVHAAFSHVPGHYRGGEGDDVAGFWQRNYLATVRLFQAAARAKARRGVFLSSRAVYDGQPPGMDVDEDTPCHPHTHYGAMKLACERHLAGLSGDSPIAIASLRATGVYGSAKKGGDHKWSDLIADYLSGKPVEPRCGTEVHGSDLACAVRLMLEAPWGKVAGQEFNVSDILLDRHDLLALVQRQTGCKHSLPNSADKRRYNIAGTGKLESLGWRPGGMKLLEREIADLFGSDG